MNNHSRVAPKLARQVYNVRGSDSDNNDSSDDDDDSSAASLEIMAPINPPKLKDPSSILGAATAASLAIQPPPPAAAAASAPRCAKTSTAKLLSVNLSDSDSDDDDDLLKQYKLKRNQPLSQRSNLSQSSNNSSSSSNKYTRTKATSSRPTKSHRSTTTAADKEEKQRERQRIREEKAQQKKAEQAARAKQRALDKEHRERKKQQEKDSKKRQREEFQQVSGKYCNQEIALLLDLPLYLDEELALTNGILKKDFVLHPQPVTYKIPNSIQWIRKDYLKGGAKDAVEQLEQKEVENFERSPYLLILMGADDFLPLLDRVGHEVDDDYPALEKFVLELQAKYQRIWKNTQHPQIIFLLRRVQETLDEMWKNHNKKRNNKQRNDGGPSMPTDWELNDAIQWLLIQFQVECIHCPSIESIHANIHKLTRGICEFPYKNHVTELECIKKLKSNFNNTTGGEQQQQQRPIDRAQDAWFRQLQQIHGLSEGMAMNAIKEYPTLSSLWRAYTIGNDNDNGSKSGLMGDCLLPNRNLSKLSHTIYRLLKSDDPKEKLT